MMDSVYQAIVMKVVGDNVFGWRFSEVLIMVASTALVYVLGVALFGRIAGVAAAIVLASSHYLMAFTHIAYNNTHMVFYSALAMLMLVLAWRTQRAVFVYSTGVAMGLCLYTVQGALLIWPTIALLLLVIFLRRPTWGQVFAGLLMLLGFVVVITPGLLTTSLSEVIRAATFLSRREMSAIDPVLVTRIAIVQSSVIFWDNHQVADHYVADSLVDFITGLLLFVGLVMAFLRLNKRAERLVLVWFIVGIVILSATTYQPQPPLTRLLYLMPAVALLAGMTVYKLYMMLRTKLRLPAVAVYTTLGALLAVIPILNLNQLLMDSPTKLQFSPFTLVMKTIQEHPMQTVIEVGAESGANQNLIGMISWYPWYEGHYKYINVSDLKSPISQGLQDNLPVFLVDQWNDTLAPHVRDVLGLEYQATKDPDPGHTIYVWLFEPVSGAAGPHR
jgi:4-amino-4-deoxy-L-arabinose transferase-like glycosyltransferase